MTELYASVKSVVVKRASVNGAQASPVIVSIPDEEVSVPQGICSDFRRPPIDVLPFDVTRAERRRIDGWASACNVVIKFEALGGLYHMLICMCARLLDLRVTVNCDCGFCDCVVKNLLKIRPDSHFMTDP